MTTQTFHGCRFDAVDGKLTGPRGQSQSLRPKVAILLATLLASPNQVVSKDALVQAIWSDGVVDFEAGLSALLKELRSALTQVGVTEDPARVIETLPRRGVRVNITPLSDKPQGLNSGTPSTQPTFPAVMTNFILAMALVLLVWAGVWYAQQGTEKNTPIVDAATETLAILPFEVYGGVEARASSEGLLVADALLSALWDASIEAVTLLGRASLSPYPDQTGTALVQSLASDLGASLIIEGRLVWGEDTLRLTGRLISSSTYEVLTSQSVEIEIAEAGASDALERAAQALAAKLAGHWQGVAPQG